MTKTETTTHAFENAGLGMAPFTWLGVEIKRGPIDLGNGLTVGAPGQAMGSCAYCGQGIAECHTIQSSDGKLFTVGCVCVGKTGDRGIVNPTKQASNKLRAAARKARESDRVAAALDILDRQAVRDNLADHPHPYAARGEFFSAKTLLDFVEWNLANAGNRGKVAAAKMVENAKSNIPVA